MVMWPAAIVTITLVACDTCCDAVKGVWQQVIQLLPLLNGRPIAVDLIKRGICVVHPLHQPFKLAIAYQVVATQIPADGDGSHELPDICSFANNCHGTKHF